MDLKKIIQWTGTIAAFGLALSLGFPVYAGDINAAEQMVINYYNGTFSYNGKTYVATEEAKASVYAKLAEDGVDLTEQEARTAIRQASGKIGEGVEQGYLAEVSSEDSGTGNTEDNEPGNGTGKPDSESETGEEESGSGNEAGGTGSGNETGKLGMEDGTGVGNGAENGNNRGLEDSGDGTGQEGTDGGGEDPSPFKKIDIAQVLEEAQQEGGDYVQIAPGGDFAITVERYLQGTVTAVSQEGYVLFEGGLPLKNTGYYTGKLKMMLTAMAAGLCITLGASISLWKKDRKRETKMKTEIKTE